MHLRMPHCETFYDPAGEFSPAEWPLVQTAPNGRPAFWPRGVEPFLPLETAEDPQAVVEVHSGRWLALCPFLPCSSRQYASPDDHRFFCMDCLNAAVGHRWVRTRWPDDPEAIDAILVARPRKVTRGWRQGETLDALIAENEAHGLPAAHPKGLLVSAVDLDPGVDLGKLVRLEDHPAFGRLRRPIRTGDRT